MRATVSTSSPGHQVVGVDIAANSIVKRFRFLPTPYDGKNRRHVDWGEAGLGTNPFGPPVP